MSSLYPIVGLLGLMWGSFLNVIAYRLIKHESILFPRSRCIHCAQTIAWYDLVPVVSWLMLKGACRSCKKPISFLYPFIELVTAGSLMLLYARVPIDYFVPYAFFSSALIVSVRTDLEFMLISRVATLFLVPIGIFLSCAELLPINPLDSLCGALFGYGMLWITAYIFKAATGKDGIGAGDFDLLCFIGSFTGIFGVWLSLTIGSIIGSFLGVLYLLLVKKTPSTHIPFGPFLALGAFITVLYSDVIMTVLMNH